MPTTLGWSVAREAAAEGTSLMEKVAVMLTYVTVCGAVNQKMVFVLY